MEHDHNSTRAKVLRYVFWFTGAFNGVSPTIREIATGVGLSSTNTVSLHIRNLVDAGELFLFQNAGAAARNIRVPGSEYSNPPLPDWAKEPAPEPEQKPPWYAFAPEDLTPEGSWHFSLGEPGIMPTIAEEVARIEARNRERELIDNQFK